MKLRFDITMSLIWLMKVGFFPHNCLKRTNCK